MQPRGDDAGVDTTCSVYSVSLLGLLTLKSNKGVDVDFMDIKRSKLPVFEVQRFGSNEAVKLKKSCWLQDGVCCGICLQFFVAPSWFVVLSTYHCLQNYG